MCRDWFRLPDNSKATVMSGRRLAGADPEYVSPLGCGL